MVAVRSQGLSGGQTHVLEKDKRYPRARSRQWESRSESQEAYGEVAVESAQDQTHSHRWSVCLASTDGRTPGRTSRQAKVKGVVGRTWELSMHGRWDVRRLSLPGSSKPLAPLGLAPRDPGQHAPPTFPWLEAWTRQGKGSQYPKELRALAAHGPQVRGCWRRGSVLESSGEEACPTELLGNEAKPWG